MSEDADYQYALALQKRLNQDDSDDDDLEAIELTAPKFSSKQKYHVKRTDSYSNMDEDLLNSTQNLVHPMWETLDPTPDISALFTAFDGKFFQSRLKCVSLEWSKRMYSCAGICYSSKNRFGMAITIRLSEPLLKLRPRKDLVETLLHEMIHAYCFVLNIREGNGGHGPHFKKIMCAINKVAGTNITVYHSFHDEVDLYKQHWWRCNGMCVNRAPFFGYVKRTSNRAPGPNDQWWAEHQRTCGGYFMKIKEPDSKRKKSDKTNKAKALPTSTSDIRKFFNGNIGNKTGTENKSTNQTSGTISGVKGPIKSNGGETLLLNPRTNSTSISKAFPPTSYPGLSTDPFNINIPKGNATHKKPNICAGNLANVVGFRDLPESGANNTGNHRRSINTSSKNEITGRGYTVGSTSSPCSDGGKVDRNHLRDIWSKRFSGETSTKQSDIASNKILPKSPDAKRRRISSEAQKPLSENEKWQRFDDDVMVRDGSPIPTVTLLSDEEDNSEHDADDIILSSPKHPIQRSQPLTATERQNAIKQEILDETTDLTDNDIILIDDEYDDNMTEDDSSLTAATTLADTSIIDEFFGEDTLLKDYILENDVRPTFSRHVPIPENDIITCPVCQSKLKRIDLEEHLNGCMGITKPVLFNPRKAKSERQTNTKSSKSKKDILRDAGYTEEELADFTINSSTDDELMLSISSSSSTPNKNNPNETSRMERLRSVYKSTRQCPVCACEIEEDEINEHLDECLANR